jgi:hypothetical protein
MIIIYLWISIKLRNKLRIKSYKDENNSLTVFLRDYVAMIQKILGKTNKMA